jgi:hypothetical protein
VPLHDFLAHRASEGHRHSRRVSSHTHLKMASDMLTAVRRAAGGHGPDTVTQPCITVSTASSLSRPQLDVPVWSSGLCSLYRTMRRSGDVVPVSTSADWHLVFEHGRFTLRFRSWVDADFVHRRWHHCTRITLEAGQFSLGSAVDLLFDVECFVA